MTPLAVSIAGALASFALVLVVLDLIRRHRLRERYALLWLVTGLILMALSLWRGGLNTIAGWSLRGIRNSITAFNGETLFGSWSAPVLSSRRHSPRSIVSRFQGYVKQLKI